MVEKTPCNTADSIIGTFNVVERPQKNPKTTKSQSSFLLSLTLQQL